ncbi:DUF3598 family protein [cf. Phormidesmis sp. LEGE 11477]|uniref:DUF3598 family protein n=1 Tax=cf. Phormidesmis sp. LEGE 11477 TaxID=1828680 RepID=UPI00188154F4|nr:DUF3598 family protein [cf. Phormidesmis sp. LEGE 11477]MBE9061229.1 DUF3598 family protein [cf. Phormidesmis sp. LEGE 11477]
MPTSHSSESLTQWQRLLKNVGTWQGSFTQLSPAGAILSDTPTEVELAPYDDSQAMRQEVRRYPADAPAQIQKLDYRTLNRATRFFETGAFSQGSIQWSPVSTFGAELGLIAGDRRLRLVQLFDKTSDQASAQASTLKSLTLIREQLQGSSTPERPPLKVSDLLGTWQGKAVTEYADLQPAQHSETQLTVERVGDRTIRQTITFSPTATSITSTGTLEGQKISFSDGSQPVQVLLLPDGASSTCPSQITPRQPLFLEVGWLLNLQTRQRLIRTYDTTGAWTSLTLVTETKQ